MNALIERLSQEQLLIAILALIGGVVAIVAIVSFTKWSLQMTANALTLDRERLQAELDMRSKIIDQAIASGANLDALLTAGVAGTIPTKPAVNSEELDGQLAKGFGMLEIPSEEIEEATSQAIALDPGRKKSIVTVLNDLMAEGASHESILAAVRGLCVSPKREAKETESAVPISAH
jgi:hypothetical protein